MSKRLLFIVLACLIVITAFATGRDTIVYITETGEKYHTERCSSVKNSKIAVTLGEAVSRGFEPCQRCKPPVLDVEE